MESTERKALTFTDFDPDLAAAMVRIQLVRHRGDCCGPGRWILNQTPEGRINAAQTRIRAGEDPGGGAPTRSIKGYASESDPVSQRIHQI